jgi:hypothetical protein
MKMPRHRPWFPPIRSRPDIFGLRHVTLAEGVCDDEELRRRFAKVEAGVKAAFAAAVNHLGEDAARELFNRVLRRPKRGRGKAHARDRDHRLLKAYDAGSGRESVASIARRLHKEDKTLGSTPGAVATQMRQLIAEREEREHRARVQARFWRMATRNEPPTLAAGGGLREK